jgi:hypothetical protein
MIQVASREFEQKMSEVGRNWDTGRLTAELAGQVCQGLQAAFSHASRQAYKHFLEHYDLPEPQIEGPDQTLRFKAVSPKAFLTSFSLIVVDRRLYQADRGGASDVPLDHLWEMDGHFATAEVRQAVCFAVAHMTPQEVAQLLTLCSCFQPSATALQHVAEKVWEELAPHQEALDTTLDTAVVVPAETKVLVASVDGANVLLREPGVRRGRPCERPRSPAPEETPNATYKNAMVGAISFYGTVPEGQPGPERLRSLYSARMPEERAGTFKHQFERRLEIVERTLAPAAPRPPSSR